MDEARALVEASRQSMDEARKSLSEIKNPPEKTKQNRSSHLRLVVSRD